MELLAAIHTRHSISKVLPDPLPRELVERLLDAAVQAPNHHRNRPWRFVVLAGSAREQLGEVMARALQKRLPETSEPALDAERKKPLRAPVLIAVGIDKSADPKVSEMEDICACAAAVENLLLAAHDLGLGAMWRTGSAVLEPDVKTFLGFEIDQHVIALVYLGYPAVEIAPLERPSSADRTRWMGF